MLSAHLDDAKRWDIVHKKTYQEEQTSVYAQEKEKLFPRSSLVVELGGGSGADALYFLQQGHSVVILDISDFALNIAIEKAKQVGLEKNLATRKVDFGLDKFPIAGLSIDIAYSRISLHYFDAEHTTKIFRDIYTMLKVGGTAYLTFKSPEDKAEMEYLKKTATPFEDNVYIENGQLRSRFTIEQLKTMLTNAGIVDHKVTPYQEKLSPSDAQGVQPILHLNEVVFSKAN